MATKDDNYKTLSAELDEILTKLQDNELDIDEATKSYERGMEVVQKLEDYLKNAQNKVNKIKAKFDSNNG